MAEAVMDVAMSAAEFEAEALAEIAPVVVARADGPEPRPTLLPFCVHVFGPQGSGKTPFARRLGELLGCKVAETSAYLMQRYAAFLSKEQSGLVATDEWWMRRLKEKTPTVRRGLVAFGDELTREKPHTLMLGACQLAGFGSGGGIIVGTRRKVELERWFEIYRKDVLIEIDGRASDDAYELAGWKSPWGTSPRFVIPAGPIYDEFVSYMASQIRALVEGTGSGTAANGTR